MFFVVTIRIAKGKWFSSCPNPVQSFESLLTSNCNVHQLVRAEPLKSIHWIGDEVATTSASTKFGLKSS